MSENSEIHKAARGTVGYFRIPTVLLGIVLLVCLGTAYDPPAGRLNWLLEVGPGLAGIAVLVALYRRFPMSHVAYWCVFLHMFILIYGGYYTYAETPLGNWARDAFDLSRNHYDRIGHVALGVFPAFIIREVLLRQTPLERGGWLYFIIISIVLAIGHSGNCSSGGSRSSLHRMSVRRFSAHKATSGMPSGICSWLSSALW